MAFQLPSTQAIEEILAFQKPSSPIDLSEVTDADGVVLPQQEAEDQINNILGESGPLPAMVFPLMEDLIAEDSPISNARINTIVRDGIVAGQMIEVRLYGAGSLDKYSAVADLKGALEPWMPVLSHPVFRLGKASLSDRLDKELRGRSGRAKGSVYLQLSWAFEFVAHSELYDYQPKSDKKASAETTETSNPETQNQATAGREF